MMCTIVVFFYILYEKVIQFIFYRHSKKTHVLVKIIQNYKNILSVILSLIYDNLHVVSSDAKISDKNIFYMH